MDKTYKLIDKLEDAVYFLHSDIEAAMHSYEGAVSEYDACSNEEIFLLGLGNEANDSVDMMNLAEYFEDTLIAAEYERKRTIEYLKDFDRTLAKVIELRGKLAEETGIPMMSHLGTEGFGRESAEFVM